MPKKITDVLREQLDQSDSRAEALQEQVNHGLANEKRLRAVLGKQELLAEAITKAIKAYPLHAVKKFDIPKHKGEHKEETVAVAQCGDSHIGEVVTEAGTDNWGIYNYDIARQRMNRLADGFLMWVEDCRMAGWNIKKFAVPCLGDWVAGNIHEELMTTCEFPLPVQIARSGQLHAEFLNRLSGHCEQMDVWVFAGNHDRLSVKRQYKWRVENSAAYPIGQYLQAALVNQKHVNIVIAESPSKLITINGHNFLASHGDDSRAWMGIPFYGIERSDGKEGKRRMMIMSEENKNVGYSYRMGGHWHVGGWFGTWLFTGSLRGTDELDHAAGRFGVPEQTAYLVHKERGVFNAIRFRIDR